MEQITTKYTCNACGDKEVKAKVRARHPNEDIKHYLDTVAEALGLVHGVRNPYCSAQKLDVYMPVTQNGIGMPGEPLTPEMQAEIRESLEKK